MFTGVEKEMTQKLRCIAEELLKVNYVGTDVTLSLHVCSRRNKVKPVEDDKNLMNNGQRTE